MSFLSLSPGAILLLLALPFYANALPHPFTSIIVPRQDANASIEAPWASNPSKPPAQLVKLPRPENPYPSGIPTQPGVCDGQNPSDDCFKTMGSGGYLWFDKDSGCDDGQKAKMETAVWDATTLANYASSFPNAGARNRGAASGNFYMGPDFAKFQDRIAGNLKRAWEFKTSKTSDSEYITMSCKDTKNLCNLKIDGKAVGGYAWTYKGWFGYYYHYITFCSPFFTVDTLDQKMTEIEDDLRQGKTQKATDMRYLRTTGQFFLHELMHTRLASGANEPHIIDEYVAPIPEGEKPGTNDVKAYGPRLVHNLANRKLNQGGGATRASTNADSYAILASALWWWDTTDYFPGVPGKNNPTVTSQADPDLSDFLVALNVDLQEDPSKADFQALFKADLSTFADGPPDTDSPTTTTTAKPSSTATATPCVGNQIEGSCVQGHLPSATPDSGPQTPVCNKVGTGDLVRISQNQAAQAAATYCANLISGKVVLDAQSGAIKPGIQPNAAENGGQLALTVLFDAASCDPGTKPENQKVDFAAIGQNNCVQYLYSNLAQVCAQDSTWTDFNKNFPLEGGVYGYSCALWSMTGEKV